MQKPRLYALSTCVHCKNTKKFLDKLGIDYEAVHVDLLQGKEREDAVRKIKECNPDLSFPTLVVDKLEKYLEWIKGFFPSAGCDF